MTVGVAKITEVVGAGKYKITQQFYDTDTNTYKDGGAGLVDADCSDLNLSTTHAVDDVVGFRMLETFDGFRQAVIMSGGSAVGDRTVVGTKGADEWISVTADGAFHCEPGPSCFVSGVIGSGSCSIISYLDIDELGHVRVAAGFGDRPSFTYTEVGPDA